MSNLLWRYYLEDDVEKFQKLLANGHNNSPYAPKSHGGGMGGGGGMGTSVGSPASGFFGTSPRTTTKSRKASGYSHAGPGSTSKGQINLVRSDVNSRDRAGLTILHRVCSSTATNAIAFATSLVEHPLVDIYIPDFESGWTALHRALYFGNITIACALMERDMKESMGQGTSYGVVRIKALIKIKDHEGNSAFDVYNSTIARRTLDHRVHSEVVEGSEDEEDGSVEAESKVGDSQFHNSIDADEIFAFGSNKNLTLGFGDEDDRQHPEKINLKRPDHLLDRFHRESLLSKPGGREASEDGSWPGGNLVTPLPALVKNRPIIIQDVALSKFHSAILTTDPESNLYICGFGPGGRLGTGDETTRFNYVCIEGGGLAGKKVVAIALGQNHSIGISAEGEVFTWGTNNWGQLGYTLPRPVLQDEDSINCTPRQIFGPLKREVVLGIAASGIHSVAFTSTSLFTWGKNEGQLGLMDSDSRSLESQTIPRRVAASLFAAPIQMVSAINRATICLLANHAVYVFTNYGYNNVKFPMHDGFSNYHLNSTPLTTRYEAEPSHINSVTSGGDTIAAISSRGDLFTINVSQKLDAGPTATSTTNPAKIRNALSQPQRVWSLRKGHWDGIKSVGVGENGSVIICTQAGAVWRRVRRLKIKDAYLSVGSEFKSKDYKFERVPGLTKVTAVRSNNFGAYVALRKDCDVTRTQIVVDPQALWKNLAPLFSLWKLQASESQDGQEGVPRFWMPALSREHFDPFKRAVLSSADLETHVLQYVRQTVVSDEEYNIRVSTTLSETYIPVHGFMLAARSSVLREALSAHPSQGSHSLVDVLSISGEKNFTLVFHSLDFLTILNLVLYVYTDRVIDVWHFTRHAPRSAFRFRQVRTELMKLASKLGMSKLESAVRLMSEPESRLNMDLALAFDDQRFFSDADTIIELDGGSQNVHSALMRQRCPFFEGLFNGRAAGQWLAGRRESESEMIKIDMKHIDPSTFEIVLRYLYTDIGTELFEDMVTTDIDEFCDIVLDVMSVSNELMLDRLSQICQQVIGRFVNTRNVCQLVNTVAPCSVTEFKDAGLEYLCLQMEAMLENHLLNDLDADLMQELDEVVRGNQLACLPFAKSGRAELLLHERHPSLAADVDQERQRFLRDMAFRSNLRDDESRLSSSFRARIGSVDDNMPSSPSQEKLRRNAKLPGKVTLSPAIRAKDSMADMIFDMDDDESGPLSNAGSPKPRILDLRADVTESPRSPITSKIPKDIERDAKEKTIIVPGRSNEASSTLCSVGDAGLSHKTTAEVSSIDAHSPGMPWSSPALPSAKLDMKEIMAQASRGRTSSLSISLSAEKAIADAAVKAAAPKMSQKERKKQQQQALQQSVSQPPPVREKSPTPTTSSTPWQVPKSGPRMSLKDVFGAEEMGSSQTQLNKQFLSPVQKSASNPRRTASPDTRFAGQQRSTSGSLMGKTKATPSQHLSTSRSSPQPQSSKPPYLPPSSHYYKGAAGQAEPSLQLSMSDIIGQQRREQDLIKEAVAKRSLQEIQEEQAFQEWWDQESKRAQEEEAARARRSLATGAGDSGVTGKGSKRGRGGSSRGKGDGGSQSRGRRRGRGGVSAAAAGQTQDGKVGVNKALYQA